MSSNSIAPEGNDHDMGQTSKLEATLVAAEVPPRPMSLRQGAINRHALVTDQNVNELDFEYSLDSHQYPLTKLNSLQEVFNAVQYHQHLANDSNFSSKTNIRCLRAHSKSARRYPRYSFCRHLITCIRNGVVG